MKISKVQNGINGEISDIASDKSISHRAAIFSLLSDKESHLRNFLLAEDTLNSLKIVEILGAKIKKENGEIFINPPKKIIEPSEILNCGNSGTAMRILCGFLASKNGFFVLNGDKYLNNRPMGRVLEPLKKAGALFDAREKNFAPLCIRGKKLDFFKFESKISSAQIKTAMILAGLNSNGCEFIEPSLSRNHTEIMLKFMGAEISSQNLKTIVKPIKNPLKPLDIKIPNDPSSAFFFAVAALILPNSKIILKDILLNKTRIEAFKILQKMGGKIEFLNVKNGFETTGDILVQSSNLNAICVDTNISWMIDEAPALGIAFACANGKSVLKNAKELRVKESDRIKTMVLGLKNCGIDAIELEDGFEITGKKANFAKIDSFGDHRIAMSFAILGLKCGMKIENSEFISTSFPNFTKILQNLGVKIEN